MADLSLIPGIKYIPLSTESGSRPEHNWEKPSLPTFKIFLNNFFLENIFELLKIHKINKCLSSYLNMAYVLIETLRILNQYF